MYKMDMIWITVALEIYPDTNSSILVSKTTMKQKIKEYWDETISDVMVNVHLVSWKPRDKDKNIPSRGGDRKRFLFKTRNGVTPNSYGSFRLYKHKDSHHDSDDKKEGKTCPELANITDFPVNYITPEELLNWYTNVYYPSSD